MQGLQKMITKCPLGQWLFPVETLPSLQKKNSSSGWRPCGGQGVASAPGLFSPPHIMSWGALVTGALDDLLRPFELFTQHLGDTVKNTRALKSGTYMHPAWSPLSWVTSGKTLTSLCLRFFICI